MAEPGADYLTERQRKWFASLERGLERDTGRSLDDWVKLAAFCPETGRRARLQWFKETYGLSQNRASLVFSQLQSDGMGWSDASALRTALWTEPSSLAILGAVEALIRPLDGVVMGQRRSFTAWSRRVQFAALRPLSKGGAMLGLALSPGDAPGFEPAGKEGWSERLTSRRRLHGPEAADAALAALLTEAWTRS